VEIKKRSPHFHRLDDYELRFHLSKAQKLSKLSGPRQLRVLRKLSTNRLRVMVVIHTCRLPRVVSKLARFE